MSQQYPQTNHKFTLSINIASPILSSFNSQINKYVYPLVQHKYFYPKIYFRKQELK